MAGIPVMWHCGCDPEPPQTSEDSTAVQTCRRAPGLCSRAGPADRARGRFRSLWAASWASKPACPRPRSPGEAWCGLVCILLLLRRGRLSYPVMHGQRQATTPTQCPPPPASAHEALGASRQHGKTGALPATRLAPAPPASRPPRTAWRARALCHHHCPGACTHRTAALLLHCTAGPPASPVRC